MSRGKYSPNCPHGNDHYSFVFNCYGKLALPFDGGDVVYDQKTHFPNYDNEGFDSYGYSCFSLEGEYLGIGCGVDRNGKTETDYLLMTDDEFEDSL